MANRQIDITTLDGQTFTIAFDPAFLNCWSVELPHAWQARVDRRKLTRDTVAVSDRSITWFSGSLSRLMDAIATYIGECEA